MRRRSLGRPAVLALAAAATAAAGDDGRDTPLSVLLERGGAYVERYGETFRSLVADEAYRQVEYGMQDSLVPRRVCNLRSDVVFVRLTGSLPWATFRDVYEADGKEVHDRARRLERLFTRPSADTHAQARAILRESSRYNLGRDHVTRNVNAPTFALLFLLPQNQQRLSFKRKGRKGIAGTTTVEIAFEETSRPTLVRDEYQDDTPAKGSIWLDPSRGTVLRTRIEYDIEKQKRLYPADMWAVAVIVTDYRRESGLDILVPDTMTEWYTKHAVRYLEGRATYSSYRRFEVESDWELVGTEAEPRP